MVRGTSRDKHAVIDERTPLVTPSRPTSSSPTRPKSHAINPLYLVLLCGFLVSLSFGVTQVPIIYVFRLMTCDAYYDEHPDALPPSHGRDRCSLPAIEAGTARAVSLLGISTTVFGTINLFITRRNIRTLGVKAALALQVLTPAIRLLIQNIGVATGGANGIIITQCSQIVTVMGGPNGYMLALNTMVTDVVEHTGRTAALGQLQGCMMLGSAVGLLVGGLLADAFGIIMPFRVTLGLFVVSTAYVLLALPFVPKASGEGKGAGIAGMFGPLRTLLPTKWRKEDGRITTEYGAMFLAMGAGLAVLATGYIPTLLQMYATDVFDFGTNRNSYLVSSYAFLRGLFLTLAFPRIIKLGRRLAARKSSAPDTDGAEPDQRSGTKTPDERTRVAQAMQDEEQEDVLPPSRPDEEQTFEFDLIYTRLSLFIDSVLTFGAAFIQQDWEMYLIAVLLPLGAGTASAAKGVVLQMCPQSERTDALSALALVEMLGRLSTTFVFGLVFAAFATIRRPELVFVCNAGVALVGVGVLMLSRFPPDGSQRLEHDNDDDMEHVRDGE